MKRMTIVFQSWIVLLALLCVCCLTPVDSVAAESNGSIAAATGEAQATPTPIPEKKAHLEALNPTYDFGTVRGGDIKAISHTFVFRNTGEAVLAITKVKPSCGCTSAIASTTQVVPGATASITATLNPKGKSGNQTITVRISSNDPDNNTVVFRMSGTILSAWRVIPLRLDMGALAKLQSVTKDVVITSQYMKDDVQFRITGIKTGSPAIHTATAVAPTRKTGTANKNFIDVQQLVKINVTAGPTEGDQSQRVYIATDDPKNPTHTVTVCWTVEADLHGTPNRVTVSDSKGRKITRDVILSSHSGRAFDVTSIEIQGKKGNDDIEVTLKPDPEPARKVYLVSPKIVTDAATDTRSGKIIFKTTDPEKPELTIPYTAVFRR